MSAGRLVDLIRTRLGLDARRVSPRLTKPVFRHADLSRCDATCCRGGVALSTRERDAILASSEAVARALEASPREGVRPRERAWFTRRERGDADFLSGRSVDTSVVAGACVFLRGDNLCAVHVASEQTAGHPYALKPAYCVLFPLCVDKGEVAVCRASYCRRPECCSSVRTGDRTPLSLFAWTERSLRHAPRR